MDRLDHRHGVHMIFFSMIPSYFKIVVFGPTELIRSPRSYRVIFVPMIIQFTVPSSIIASFY